MTTSEIQASLDSYDVSLLMTQTRKLASDYRRQTGQALPVTEELARFDAISILGLAKVEGKEGIDAKDKTAATKSENQYLIKGRVIFKAGKARQKLGGLNLQYPWTHLLMVIYDAEYLPTQIHKISREIIDRELENSPKDKRGSMTVAKYKAIGELIWENPEQNANERTPKD